MDTWMLVEEGRYAAAAEEYSQQVARDLSNPVPYNNRGTVRLLLSDFPGALADFAIAGYLSQGHGSTSDNSLLSVGAVLWVAGREHDGAALWSHAVNQMLKNRFTHSDGAGGVRCGCLLWFAATHFGDSDHRRLAERLFVKKLGKAQRDRWPAPIAQFLMGDRSIDALLGAVSNAQGLRQRHLCQAHFYAAAKARHQADAQSARSHLAAAREQHAPIELEYHLAKLGPPR